MLVSCVAWLFSVVLHSFHEFAKRLPQRLVKKPREAPIEMTNHDEFNDVGVVFVRASKIGRSARQLHFDQPGKPEHSQALNNFAVFFASGFWNLNSGTASGGFTRQKKMDGDASFRPKFSRRLIPGQSS